MVSQFQESLNEEIQQYLINSSKNFLEAGKLHSLPDNSLIKKMSTRHFSEAVLIALDKIEMVWTDHEMLNHEQRACIFKTVPKMKNLCNLINSSPFNSRLFQLAMCTSAWRRLEKDDVAILLSIGFKEAASQIIEKEVNYLHQTTSFKAVQTPKGMYIIYI